MLKVLFFLFYLIVTLKAEQDLIVKGNMPNYLSSVTINFANVQAVMNATFVPDLDLGFVPQGIEKKNDTLITGYSKQEHKCSIYRINEDNNVIKKLYINECTHAGGISLIEDKKLVVSDTRNIFILQNNFITKLYPVDRNIGKNQSGNVIQGIASFKDLWIVTQTYKDNYLILNILNNTGKSIFNTRIDYPSHGQDLSLIFDKENDTLTLFTTSEERKGIVRIILKYDSKFTYEKYQEINLNSKYSTPTISEDKKFIASRNGKNIEIYNYNSLLLEKKEVLFKFNISEEQSQKGQYFQGIAMKDNLVYCLTGNSNPVYDHFLYVYDLEGEIKFSSIITPGKEFYSKEGSKYELEGLTFKGNDLYTTVMTGTKGKNIKRLYKILEVKE